MRPHGESVSCVPLLDDAAASVNDRPEDEAAVPKEKGVELEKENRAPVPLAVAEGAAAPKVATEHSSHGG